MHLHMARTRRCGSVLPLIVVCLVALIGMVALAIDLGLMMVARTQCQNAADSAAMVGARTLNGDVANNNNYSAAGPAAVAAAGTNSILSAPVAPGQVTVTIGSYSYDTNSNSFVINPTSKSAADNWTLAQATVHY